jgi:hypothetical protein
MVGIGYINNNEQRANWVGRLVYIDEASETLGFRCDVTIISENIRTDAVTQFTLFSDHTNRPNKMDGTSANVSDGRMLQVHMKKLSDDTVFDKSVALKAAAEYRKEFTNVPNN